MPKFRVSLWKEVMLSADFEVEADSEEDLKKKLKEGKEEELWEKFYDEIDQEDTHDTGREIELIEE